MRQRKLQYDFLSRVFREPLSHEFLKEWKELIHHEIELSEQLEPFFHEMNHSELNEIAEKEKQHFLTLFFGPEHILAPPWESVHRSEDGLLFGEATLKMREKLRSFDLVFEGGYKELEDHISIELEFMGYLISKTIDLIEKNEVDELIDILHDQYSFLDEHLTKWIGHFTNRIQLNTSSSLYRGAARFLNTLIQQDYQYLKEIKEVTCK